MSENKSVALALFAECDSLFQNLSDADESAISGGTNGRRRPRRRRRRRRRARRRRGCGNGDK